MKEKLSKQNKMATMPVPKLLINMGLPMIISMVSLALYNMVDTFFVSKIADTAEVVAMGDKAVNALTLAHPIQVVMIAFGVGSGIAINTLTARYLGMKNQEKAERIAYHSVLLGLFYFILFLLFGIFGARAFIATQTSDPVILELGTSYLKIVSIFSLGTMCHMCMEKAVIATGRTMVTTVAQFTGAIVNIILDPILIFGWLGLPAMGVNGAAIATVIGQFVSMFIVGFILFFKTPSFKAKLRGFIPDWETIKEHYRVALPAIGMQLLVPVMNYGMNIILGGISVSEVTAYGVYGRLQYICTMMAFGINNACLPSASFNRGRKDYKRFKQIMLYGILYATVTMAVCIAVLQIFTRPIIGIFSITDTSADYAAASVHIVTCGYLFLAANIILQGSLQSMGHGVQTLIIAALRSAVIVLPLALALSKLPGGDILVWIAIPAAEAVGLIFAIIFAIKGYRGMICEIKS